MRTTHNILVLHIKPTLYTLLLVIFTLTGCKKGDLTVYQPAENYQGLKERVEAEFIRPFEEGTLWTIKLQPRDNQTIYNFYLMKEDGKYAMRGTGFNDVTDFEVEVQTVTDALGAILSFSEDALFTRVITALTKDRTRGSDISYTFLKRENKTMILEGNAYADLLTLTQIDPESDYGKVIRSNPVARIKQQLIEDFGTSPGIAAISNQVFSYITLEISDGKLYYFGGYDASGAIIKGSRTLSIGGTVKDTLIFDSPIPSSNSQGTLNKLIYDPIAEQWLVVGLDGAGSTIQVPITPEKMGKTSISPWDYMSYLQTFTETQQVFLGRTIGDLFPPPLLAEKNRRSFKVALPPKSASTDPTDILQIFANEAGAAYPLATFDEVEFIPRGNSMTINVNTSYGFFVSSGMEVSRVIKSGPGNVTLELNLSYAAAYQSDQNMAQELESAGLGSLADTYRNNLKMYDGLGKSFAMPGKSIMLSWLDPASEGGPPRILWTSPTDPSIRIVMEN